MLRLRTSTPMAWVEAVVGNLDVFLQDHAANERKVSGSVLRLAVQYPERRPLVDALVGLAREELEHFQRVYDLLVARGATLGQDAPDPYMGALRRLMRKRDIEEYLLDRLIVFGVVEARACERFTLLSHSVPDEHLRAFYRGLGRAEARHHGVFLRLAHRCACCSAVASRLGEVLDAEAAIVAGLPIRAALH